MNTELTPYLMVRTPLGFFRLAVLNDTSNAKDQATVTFHMASQASVSDRPSYEDLGMCLVYELVPAPNRDRVKKSFIDAAQALVNHAGLMAQGMGLKYTHCSVQFFGTAFSAVSAVTNMLQPISACGGEG